jgi:hypothetical protein
MVRWPHSMLVYPIVFLIAIKTGLFLLVAIEQVGRKLSLGIGALGMAIVCMEGLSPAIRIATNS